VRYGEAKRSSRNGSQMCGRYMIISSPEAIRRLFGYPGA
jgi:hypothetical protein